MTRCECSYADLSRSMFFSVDVYFDNYKYENDQYHYGDQVFEDEMQKYVFPFKISFSESGMQGITYSNLDVWYKGRE